MRIENKAEKRTLTGRGAVLTEFLAHIRKVIGAIEEQIDKCKSMKLNAFYLVN